MAAPAPAPDLNAQNVMARQILLSSCIDAWQEIYSQSFGANLAGQVVNVPLRNVGLIKRLIVQVEAEIAGTAGPTHTLTTLGMSNFFSNITFTDLSNNTRINTTGWHLMTVASAKNRFAYGASFVGSTGVTNPYGYGNNYTNVVTAPATITADPGTSNVFAMFEIPFAYSDTDLRGAIFANVVNATMNLQLTVNPNMLAISTDTDAVGAVYQSSNTTRATLDGFTIKVYQNYLDQIPVTQNGPVLPLLDISTAYILQNTTQSGIVANADNNIPYANFRDFLSTTLIYNNAGTLNAGSDINYFAIQSANYTNILKTNFKQNALQGRLRLASDFPKGMYYWDHRAKPISTIQYGNMGLIVNPSSVTTGASFLIGYEALAVINQVTQAGSLASM